MRVLALGLLAGCQVVFPLDDADKVCGGNAGDALFTECLTSPRPEIVRPASILTGDIEDPTAVADCDLVHTQTDLDRTEVCVIAADDIELANTLVVGTRPLVLMAANELLITGVVSVASRGAETGAGADFAGCASAQGSNGSGDGGGGGGSGGSFGGVGGNGGSADLELSGGPGGLPGVAITPLTLVRGGCRGGFGGSRPPGDGGAAGRAAGGIYLVAGNRITLAGAIDAAGEGGKGGAPGDDTGGGGGGGGGGSGGLIAFDAPSIVFEDGAILLANGGGGGGGGNGVDTPGVTGATADPSSDFPFAAVGGGGTGAGDGGDGADANLTAAVNGHDLIDGSGGGGGGGGGFGIILLFGEVRNLGVVFASPPLP